jgi:hypothetical protein
MKYKLILDFIVELNDAQQFAEKQKLDFKVISSRTGINGSWPEIELKGEKENILNFLEKFHSSKKEAISYFKKNATQI